MSGADRFSSLPDEIILHILSFLPTTKLRAQTSVLSKRWREIWTHLPSLHICVNKSGGGAAIAGAQFVNAVAGCILSFKPLSIHHLSADLWFPTSFAPEAANLFAKASAILIQFAGLRSARKLRIHALSESTYDNSSPIPDSLYCCTSLVDLKINSGTFPAVPVDFNGFRYLKSLSLNHVAIDTDELGYLLGCCDRLETVSIIGCDGFTFFAVGPINLPKLRDLTVYFCEDLVEASVEAAHLNSIVYEGDLQCLEFYISRVLYEAALRQEITTDLDTQAHFMSVLFSVENASVLTANDWFYQFVISEPGVLYNLKDLTLYIDEELTESMLKVLITNIGECPKLETFHLDFIYVPRDSLTLDGNPPQLQYNDALLKFVEENDEQDWCDLPELGPKCSLLQLKTVVLRDFLGSTNEMLLVKFLLGNSVALEKFYVFDFLERDEEELEELFAPFPRASSQVQLKLSLSENWTFNLSTRHSWLFS